MNSANRLNYGVQNSRLPARVTRVYDIPVNKVTKPKPKPVGHPPLIEGEPGSTLCSTLARPSSRRQLRAVVKSGSAGEVVKLLRRQRESPESSSVLVRTIYSRFRTDKQSRSHRLRIRSASAPSGARRTALRLLLNSRIRASAVPQLVIAGTTEGPRPPADVLVLVDLTRLSRSKRDMRKLIDRQCPRCARYRCSGRIRQRSPWPQAPGGLSGIIGEAFREMISEKTYSALESARSDDQ